jgi:uncharacterized protein (UPF0179 family)
LSESVGKFCDRCRYIDNCLNLLEGSVTDVDILTCQYIYICHRTFQQTPTIVNVSTSVTESSIDNCLSLLEGSVTDVDTLTIVRVCWKVPWQMSIYWPSNRLRQLSMYLHLSQNLPTDSDNCHCIYICHRTFQQIHWQLSESIGRFCDRCRYIDNCLSLLEDSVTDVDPNRLRQLSIYLHLSQNLPTDSDNCQYIYICHRNFQQT